MKEKSLEFINFINNNNDLFFFHKDLQQNKKAKYNGMIFERTDNFQAKDWLYNTLVIMYLSMLSIRDNSKAGILENSDILAIENVYQYMKECVIKGEE